MIIVLHGAPRSTAQCLEALAGQDRRVDEVVLAHSASTRPPRPPAGLDLRTVVLDEWTGPHAARNVGVAACSGDVIAFTDADCVPEPSWLRRLIAPLTERTADLAGGAVACGDARWIDRGAHRAKFGLWAPGSCDRDRSTYPTANLAVRRDTWDAVGPFALAGWSGDTEFVWRARALGARTVFVPDAVVRHSQEVTLAGLWRERRERGRAYGRLRRAVGDEASGWWAAPAWAPVVACALVAQTLSVAVSAGEAADAVSTLPAQLLAQLAWRLGETSRRHPT